MLAQIGKFFWDRPSLMMYLALCGALATIFFAMWLFGEFSSESPGSNFNVLREGVKIPPQ